MKERLWSDIISKSVNQLCIVGVAVMLLSLSMGGVAAYAYPYTPQTQQHATIVFIGDSLTKGDSNPNNWPYYVGLVTGVKVVNLGVNFSASAHMRGQVTYALSYHPKYVVVLSGGNDIYWGDAWTEQNLAVTYKAIVAGGATPVLCLRPALPYGSQAHDPAALNQWIRACATVNHYPLIDFYTPMELGGRMNPAYDSYDRYHHPNYVGYAVMGRAAADVLRVLV